MGSLSLYFFGLFLAALQLFQLLINSASANAAATTFDYSDALDKTLFFFEAQRSGQLPSNQRVQWRADSCLNDGFSQQVNLVGGYYDAGDNVKFGLPMAFSVTLMSWAAIDFRQELISANQLEHTLQAIKWGTDYFLKAHSQTNVLWVQVGDGEADHSCWQRPEDLTGARKAYKVDSSKPGSDVAGETAAALAAASFAFQPYNSSYSALLLLHAKQLFSFADLFRGQYDDSIPAVESFYPSSGYSDELLWAAAWLYRATNNNYYLQYASYNGADLGGTGNAVKMFSWDNKYAGVQILLSKVLLDGEGQSYTNTLKQYKAKADYFTCAYLGKNNGYNVPMTPGGLAYLLASNNLQYAASASFLLAIYSDYLCRSKSVVDCPDGKVQPQNLLNFAKSQADYILGKNPQSMSYLVGYGTTYPKNAHHRASSIPSIHVLQTKLDCVQGFEDWYKNSGPNPNVLYGALLGGPDSSDCFSDDRDNYAQSEATLTSAAPLIGLFSKLNCLSSSSLDTGYGYDSPTTPPQSPYSEETSAPSTPLGSNSYQYPSASNMSQDSPAMLPPVMKEPSIVEVPQSPPNQPLETPVQSKSVLQPSILAPAPGPGYFLGAPAPSPLVADYVLITQPINSAPLTHKDRILSLVLRSITLFFVPLLAIL